MRSKLRKGLLRGLRTLGWRCFIIANFIDKGAADSTDKLRYASKLCQDCLFSLKFLFREKFLLSAAPPFALIISGFSVAAVFYDFLLSVVED